MKSHIEFDIELKRNKYGGLYVVLEGIDGSGKTTQVEKLTQHFKSIGKEVVKTREPRKEGIIGDLVQKVLSGNTKIHPFALQYLFSADRVIHHEEVIIPALKSGKIVISDRCFWSAIVYGILDRTGGKYDRSVGDLLLISQSILSMYHQFTVPDYTFYLKISLEESLKRILEKEDAKEIYEDKEKLRKVIEGYDWLVGRFSKEIILIDGEKSIEEVTAGIVSNLPK